MDYIREPERQTPIVADTDLLVCGGGFAGVAAAVSAARLGVKVLLLEKYGFLGGLATGGLVITTPPLDNGINREIGERLRARGVYVPCRDSGEEFESIGMHAIDPEFVKHDFQTMLAAAGVAVRLHTLVAGVVTEGERITGVITESKAGRQAIRARILVDASGDADLVFHAGAPFRLLRKPMTMMFNMVGVDTRRALERVGNWRRMRTLIKEAMGRGELRFTLGTEPEFGAPGVNAAQLVYDGEINVWSGNLPGLDGTDPMELTQAEFVTRDHAMAMAEYLIARVPGFEKARIEVTATQVGVRATRQIVGHAMPSAQQVRAGGSPETVAKPYARDEMRIPVGSLLPRGVENLLVAGRCLSAEDEILGQLRLIPVCSATGQAAGVAAALALAAGRPPAELRVAAIQEALARQGMDLCL
ncbi:MAG: FAD-dependent oxidoreductase [Candidatus Methylomirabilota bacterium]